MNRRRSEGEELLALARELLPSFLESPRVSVVEYSVERDDQPLYEELSPPLLGLSRVLAPQTATATITLKVPLSLGQSVAIDAYARGRARGLKGYDLPLYLGDLP